jgi:hypothetical protein
MVFENMGVSFPSINLEWDVYATLFFFFFNRFFVPLTKGPLESQEKKLDSRVRYVVLLESNRKTFARRNLKTYGLVAIIGQFSNVGVGKLEKPAP